MTKDKDIAEILMGLSKVQKKKKCWKPVVGKSRAYRVPRTMNDLKMYTVLLLKLKHPDDITQENAMLYVANTLKTLAEVGGPAAMAHFSNASVRKKLRSFYRALESDWSEAPKGKKIEFTTFGSLSQPEKDSLSTHLDKCWRQAWDHYVALLSDNEMMEMMRPDRVANCVSFVLSTM